MKSENRDIFVVTHTESIHHIKNKVGGWHDTGLTERGRKQATAVAERLFSVIGDQGVEIFSSDLQRAQQTAAAIGGRFGRPVTETAALREISYGVAEGQEQAWLDARYVPAPDDDRLDHKGGIEGAESRRDVANRIYPYVEMILARECPTQIIVTHGFSLSLVIAAWMKVPIESCGFIAFPAPKGGITHLRQDAYFRNRAVVSHADSRHLSAGK
jgi:broad specificity phosphatase PhoE